jgi:hypothetical protein
MRKLSQVLVEPSWADAIRTIETAKKLPVAKRRHWVCSLRIIAKALGRAPDYFPARWTAMRGQVARLHHHAAGVQHKTLSNHKANARAALLWFVEAEDVPRRGVPLSPVWAVLSAHISCLRTRRRLYSPLRYWSARGVTPDAVDERSLDEYMRYRADSTALAVDPAARRGIARAWNACAGTIDGWPTRRLSEPPCTEATSGLPWEAFPTQLRGDIEAYLSGLRRIRKSNRGRRYRPCKDSTIDIRRKRLIACARKAVAGGVPIDQLASLHDLLSIDMAQRLLSEYWPDQEKPPSIYTIDLFGLLRSLAFTVPDMDEAALAFLDDTRAELDSHRRGGLTKKNLALIRQVMTPGVWARVVALPQQLMGEARECRVRSPVKAAVLAQMACAIAILTVAPVRRGNLISIVLDQHLHRPGGPAAPYWLTFPDYDVKNRMRLDFQFDEQATALIDEYVNDYLPILRRGSNGLLLFPGEKNARKGAATLSQQITNRVQKCTGLRVTVHQFRHAAAAIALQADPGNYEFVRRILGHKSIQTTINFYVGLETTEASRQFGRIVRGLMSSPASLIYENQPQVCNDPQRSAVVALC